jgi:hydrogenase large subunit
MGLTNRGSGTFEVDPISRIEGHLGIRVTTGSDGVITDASAHGNLFRGFENFLLGREINDAITFVQRICGVCPVPHGLTSTYAADTVLGYSRGHITFANNDASDKDAQGAKYGVPEKAVLIRNLVQGAEFLMSSITHFYHLAAPSYVQGPGMPPWTPYFHTDYYHAALKGASSGSTDVATKGVVPEADLAKIQLWDAVIISYVRALKIRRLTFEAGALFAGRMPMTSCFVAGGVTNDGTEDLNARVAQFRTLIQTVGLFIINEYVPIALVLGMLYPECDSNLAAQFNGNTTHVGYGGGLGRFLAWGGFPNLDGTLAFKGGVKGATHDFTVADKAGVYANFLNKFATDGKTLLNPNTNVSGNLTEDIANSRYAVATTDVSAYTNNAAYPGAVTRTKPARSNGYSYIKAPRWNGQACEVGPLARLAVADLYPVDGTTSLWDKLPAGAAIYFKASALDTAVISDTIVHALANHTGGSLVQGATDWIHGLKGGLSTMDRLRARALESVVLVQKMVGTIQKDSTTSALSFASDGWIDQLAARTGNRTFTATAASDTLTINAAVNGLANGTAVKLAAPKAPAVLPAPLVEGTTYYVSALSGNTFKLAATSGGPAIDLTANGSGTVLTSALLDFVGSTYRNKAVPVGTFQGWGANEAPRGALMHQAKITGGKIVAYQCIVPTTWNASPKDSGNNHGAMEAAVIGAPFAGNGAVYTNQNGVANQPTAGGVEVLRIAQSFDPCIACAVH